MFNRPMNQKNWWRSLASQIKAIYLGVISGLLLNILLSFSVWIEMRMNTSLVIPVSIIVVAGGFHYLNKEVPVALLLAMQGVWVSVFTLIYKFDPGAWIVIPAALLRDGLYLNYLSLSQINLMLICLIVSGNLCLFLTVKDKQE